MNLNLGKPGNGLYFDLGGGGVEILSEEEQTRLLQEEDRLARERDEIARADLAERETEREARERAEKMLAKQQEQQRIAEIEAQERAGADVAADIAAEPDSDEAAAGMFSSLFFGSSAGEEDEDLGGEDNEEARPE